MVQGRLLAAIVVLYASNGLATETTAQDHSGSADKPIEEIDKRQIDRAEPIDCSGWNSREFFESAVPEDIAACLEAGANPNARDDSDRTPLHHAAYQSDDVAVTEALIAAGADPLAQDDNESTPLHVAAYRDKSGHVLNPDIS